MLLSKSGVAAAAGILCLAPLAAGAQTHPTHSRQSTKCDDVGAFPCEIERRYGERRYKRGPGDVTVNPYSTERDAIRSISQALNIVRDGGRVFVYPGVYRERLAITKNVEVIGINIDVTPGVNPSFLTTRDIDPGVIIAPPASVGSIDHARPNSAAYHFADEPCLFMRRNKRAVFRGVKFLADALNTGDDDATRTPCIYVPQGQFELIGGAVERTANKTGNPNIPLIQTNGGAVTIRNSRISGGAEGVWVNANGAFAIEVRLIDNEIMQNTEGVRISGQNAFNPIAVNAFISGNNFIGNRRFGVRASAGSGVQIIGNVFSNNGQSVPPVPLGDGPVVVTIRRNDQVDFSRVYSSMRNLRRAVRSTRGDANALFQPDAVAWRRRMEDALDQDYFKISGDQIDLDAERILVLSAPWVGFPANGCSDIRAADCEAAVHVTGMSANWTGDHQITGNRFLSPSFITMSFVGGGSRGYLPDRYLRGVRDNSFPIQEISIVNYRDAREFMSGNRFVQIPNRRRGRRSR